MPVMYSRYDTILENTSRRWLDCQETPLVRAVYVISPIATSHRITWEWDGMAPFPRQPRRVAVRSVPDAPCVRLAGDDLYLRM